MNRKDFVKGGKNKAAESDLKKREKENRKLQQELTMVNSTSLNVLKCLKNATQYIWK